ncbi:MAG: helix-turn-helix domain-containing protein [Mycobacteriales bacterium]
MSGDSGIGDRLSAARKASRLSTAEVARSTRLRPELIDALERDDFARSGGEVFARAHIRALAKVVGEKPEEMIELYDAYLRRTRPRHRWQRPDRTRAGLLPDARQRRYARRWTRQPRMMWALAASAVLVLVIAAWLAAHWA